MSPSVVLEQLEFARRIADYADRLGVHYTPATPRIASDHIGAVLADAILQAGMSYRTVVRVRVDRIHSKFPEAATLSGLIALLDCYGAVDFLSWTHPTKLSRFMGLTNFLCTQQIDTTIELKHWLVQATARKHLLGLHGIGPKTYDYLCCLVGIDCIAVDRHVRTFANEAGVDNHNYDFLQSVVSYAADLLGMPRRDFDAWIWRTISSRMLGNNHQLSLI
ncbi:MAG: hypothetical protein DELT_01166 [Desulfovibrio sp.]